MFLTLRVFSATGGIEKVSRVAGKALQELASASSQSFHVFSMYDRQQDVDERYIPAQSFRGFAKNKFHFISAASRQGVKCRQVVLSHSNLLLAGFIIKMLSPKTRLVLWAHGIEVWYKFSWFKKYMLGKCDQIIAVSRFTKEKMMETHGIPENKITVVNNCLDPFLNPPVQDQGYQNLSKRYGLNDQHTVLITLTRLSYKEQYKGYDQVLYAIKELKFSYPLIRYLLVGKYDQAEKQRIDTLIKKLGLEENIIITGFIPDSELAAHYDMATLYIMPSQKEGFGIVFIEAMYYGKPVIAGNKDGSADALAHGKFGLLINPDDKKEITAAIIKVMNNVAAFTPGFKQVMEKFSYPVYKEQLQQLFFDTTVRLQPQTISQH